MKTRMFPTRRAVPLAAAVCLLCAAPVWAANPYYSLAGLKAAGIQKFIDDAKSQGYEIAGINGYQVGDHIEYAGGAVKNPNAQTEARFDLTEGEYMNYIKEMRDKGFHPYGQSTYHTKKGPRFASAWCMDKFKPAWDIKINQTEKDFKSALADKRTAGMVLWNATAYQGSDGAPRFTSVFIEHKDATYENGHNLTADKLNEKLDHWHSDGFFLLKIHAYGTPDGLRFLAIARKDKGSKNLDWKVRIGMTGDQYQKEFDKMAGQGYGVGNICGYLDGGETHYLARWVKSVKK